VSLLVANAVSMVVRIAFTGSYIRRRFVRLKVNTDLKFLSKTYLLVRVLVVFSIVAHASARVLRRNPTSLALLAHTGCGAAILAVLLVTLYFNERDALLHLSRNDKGD
ncbi:hypothetical protein BE221DRAFT_65387, partial [Ostreococcus tauri]